MLEILKDCYVANSPEDDTYKVLRTFVTKLPKRGQLALMSEIKHLKDNSPKLRQLRNFLVDTILKPSMPPFPLLGVPFSQLVCSTLVMVAGGKSPKTTPTLDPMAEDVILSSMATIEPSSRNDQGRLKADCLRRDGYSCALTRKVDGEFKDKVPGATGEIVLTQCAHILPFSLRKFDGQSAQEVKHHFAVPPSQTLAKC